MAESHHLDDDFDRFQKAIENHLGLTGIKLKVRGGVWFVEHQNLAFNGEPLRELLDERRK